ncbi:MAG: S-layer homology domain-containing protein [Oscillospiraceae bacterium]|nr:S-layer homology domain-containing protein [Oscillospiraceae bacterium]
MKTTKARANMRKKAISIILAVMIIIVLLPALPTFAISDANNGDWSAKTATLKNTSEAELMVRVGDIDALNDVSAIDNGYNPFTAKDQRSHSYPWNLEPADPAGTDRIYVGSRWNGGTLDGYSSNFATYKNGGNQGGAYGDGALSISFNYDASGISLKNVLLQICIDDFQALNWGSNFTVTLNGKDAPFIAELLNHVDQTGPTSYIISAVIPSGFYSDISSGKLVVTIDETTGIGDGYAVDFAKLLINYNDNLFTGEFSGKTDPGATVRLLGTSTTVTAGNDGNFTFKAIPGLNAVRASKTGFKENYDYGIVLSSETEWQPYVPLSQGTGSPDIDFSKFASTAAWSNASQWATPELQKASDMGLIPDSLKNADLTKPITRAEFAAIAVKVYETLSGTAAAPAASNPFTDTKDTDVLKAYNTGLMVGVSSNTFEPNTLLNREQAATALTRVLKRAYIPGWTFATDGNYTLNFTQPAKFADDANISDWAKPSVYFMVANGILSGVGGNKFAPKNVTSSDEAIGYANATREQALVISVRMVENLKDKTLNYTQSATQATTQSTAANSSLTLADIKKAAQNAGYDVTDDYFPVDSKLPQPVNGIVVKYTKDYATGGTAEDVQVYEFKNKADADTFAQSLTAPDAWGNYRPVQNGRFVAQISYSETGTFHDWYLDENAVFELILQIGKTNS